MSLFRLDSSIRGDQSVSHQVADTVERAYLAEHPGGAAVRRDLGREPLPATAWADALAAGATPDGERTQAQRDAVDLAATLGDEVLRADAVVVSSPLYNFGVSAHLKAWIDLLITDPRFAPGATPLAGRAVTLVVSRGGGYGPGTPREGWDHATGWVLRILRDVWGADVTLVEVELTLAELQPAMAELRPLAARLLAQAHETAERVGRELAGAPAAA